LHIRLYTNSTNLSLKVGRGKRVRQAEATFSRHVLALLSPLQYFFWLVFHSNAYVNCPFIFFITCPMFILTSLGTEIPAHPAFKLTKKVYDRRFLTASEYLKNCIAALYIVDIFFSSSEPMHDRGGDSVHKTILSLVSDCYHCTFINYAVIIIINPS